jgi:hypothetical protein
MRQLQGTNAYLLGDCVLFCILLALAICDEEDFEPPRDKAEKHH